jgi:hypothetical protein
LCAVIIQGYRKRRSLDLPESALLGLSGIFYVLPYALISSGADFRYIWWMIICSLLACWLYTIEAGAWKHRWLRKI